jgi:hypothetical protein
MDGLTIDAVLASIGERLHLSKETEHELLAEIRSHLEEAVAQATARGEDGQAALRIAAQKFGIEETSTELSEIHGNHDALDAILTTALPVLLAVVMRWVAFAPDGSARNWRQLLTQPGFYLLAGVTILIPTICFRRWRYALVSWSIFWLITVVFFIFPAIHR